MRTALRFLAALTAAALTACSSIPPGSTPVPPPPSLMGKWVLQNDYSTIELPNSVERGIPMDMNSLMDDIRHDAAAFVNPRAEFDPAGVTFTAAGQMQRSRYRTWLMPDGRYFLRGISKSDAYYDARARRIHMPRGLDAGQLQVPFTLRPAGAGE
jgi:hypothetical protein